jgi:hypothetical protein
MPKWLTLWLSWKSALPAFVAGLLICAGTFLIGKEHAAAAKQLFIIGGLVACLALWILVGCTVVPWAVAKIEKNGL